MHDSYKQKKSLLKGKLIWYMYGREVNSSQAKASPRLIAYITMLGSSLLPFLHAELTETKLRGFDKRANQLNISVKISKINLILAEKLTPYLFYFVMFARYGRRA